jgi:hypothetical protein
VVDNDLLAYEKQAMHFDRSSDEDEADPENLPVFVETAESRQLDPEQKRLALDALHKARAKPAEARSSSGRWVAVDGALGKRPPAGQPADSSADATSSDESEDRPRRRHDMSDSDIEVDSEERNQQKQEQERAFKHTLEKALGIDPDEHRPADLDQSEASAGQPAEPQDDAAQLMKQVRAAHQLEEAKRRERETAKLAEQFRHATTVIRDKDGRALDLADLQASREARLKALNEANVDPTHTAARLEGRHGAVRGQTAQAAGA